ncbi:MULTISPECIES: succinyl-diaminopimelate desuccinylase [Acidiphilium]|uniref:Succinyl-diaminopimelate desuccinylase n=2 Tax=Acidiphilium TaxID=522 RepID=DAPE_ACICJ|nr:MULTISPECIES: succinyl-diaminopimelate desuccinylase [Acidiphilium]A5FYQ7.1 RecName: Full=Succinyl-diaminopimelate desuccinylase; Short=SDAP desuccinylase; AltName: Full=N-succinyl-LL-2,6-diaminoheptanedioate amidohydrolase [Acidiphilium cryptum JF-5]ABQ30739.1 succinyldiaminopimelate desuccinylase [Acidiphilium cryptum JF-5]UNC15216.1 succinyl-diaminopimelate desuccinylase [Acidiphilium multivorum]BAJ80924.1 succinyl-diaminopimelate desuccinylase [Acidiphilium multivorum AIU301]GAN73324.1 
MTEADPVPLARDLLRSRSVTPEDDGAQTVLARALDALGFSIEWLRFGEVSNLVARRGSGSPHFGFAGHTDVVPPGEGWRHDPFAAVIEDGLLFGRGAVDMKGAIAAFVAALAARPANHAGTISLLITGDEEGDAVDGTRRILDHLAASGALPEFCLVGEPTCRARLGDTIKIGRRGSISAHVTVRGVQGHVAYPHLADNPLHRLIPALEALRATTLDEGTAWFEPSSLQITSVDTGNKAGNVIPASASARLNIRFNDRHTGPDLAAWIRDTVARHAPGAACDIGISGEAFLTEPGPVTTLFSEAVAAVTGITPKLDTGGGTSDARFIAAHCPVAEFGLVGTSMHRVDEAVPVSELRALAEIYGRILDRVFR